MMNMEQIHILGLITNADMDTGNDVYETDTYGV